MTRQTGWFVVHLIVIMNVDDAVQAERPKRRIGMSYKNKTKWDDARSRLGYSTKNMDGSVRLSLISAEQGRRSAVSELGSGIVD